MGKKDNNALGEAILLLRRTWNHRKINIKVGKKQFINIDHTIPGLVQDTIDALWGTKEKDLRPLINKKHKKDGDNGWDLVIYLPPGISYRDFVGRLQYFQDATGGAVEIKRQGKAAVMTIMTDELKRSYPYK